MDEKKIQNIEQTQIPESNNCTIRTDHCNIHEKYNRYCRLCDNMRVKKLYYDNGRELVTCDICKRKVVKYAYKKHLESMVHFKATFAN